MTLAAHGLVRALGKRALRSTKRFRPQTFVIACCLGAWSVLSAALPAFTQDESKYYERLLDATFYDVNRVVELGMDFALSYRSKIEKEFVEWAAGRDMKSGDTDDSYQAMERLHQGWRLLLQSATVFHEARERKIDDATTRRLEAEAKALRQQGIAKVKERRMDCERSPTRTPRPCVIIRRMHASLVLRRDTRAVRPV